MTIYRHLGGDPWRFLPWDMERLTREQVFEIYLEPAKDDENEPDGGNSLTHREQSFANMMAAGKTWLESQREYQEWLKQRRKRDAT